MNSRTGWFRRGLRFERLESRQLLYGAFELGLPAGEGEAAPRPDFTLQDVNTASSTYEQPVSPRDYLEQVSGWYFANGMWGYCRGQYGRLDAMQKDIETTYPVLRIQLLGVNAYGQDAGNSATTLGRELPWLQDVDADHDGRGDAASLWNVSYREVYILDGANVQVAAFDVESNDLNQSANYTALQQLLVDAAMTSQKPWRNADEPLDVNDNDRVEPLDALIIINKLNDVGPYTLPPPQAGDLPMRYYDCNGDGNVGPVDALNIINRLNEQNGANAEGEGGADATPVAPFQPVSLAASAPNDLALNEPLSPMPDEAANRPEAAAPNRVPATDENRSPISTAAARRLDAGPADSGLLEWHPLEELDWWLAVRGGDEPLLEATRP